MIQITLVPSAWAAEAAEDRAISMDEERFRTFYETTARALRGYLVQITRNPAAADDLLQESYCRMLTAKLPVMDEKQTRSYLFRIATNLARDLWRRKENEAQAQDREVRPIDLDLKHDLESALARLNLRERQMLWLAYVEGWSHVEIATVVGVRATSVRLLLFRARHKVAKALHAELKVKEKGQ